MEFVSNGEFSNVASGPHCGYVPFGYAAVCFIHRGKSANKLEQGYSERLYLILKIHHPHIVAKERLRDLRIHCVQMRMRYAKEMVKLLTRYFLDKMTL